MGFKFEKEFREKYPESIGETDDAFDTSNYADFLEERLLKLEAQNLKSPNKTHTAICDPCPESCGTLLPEKCLIVKRCHKQQ